MIYLILFYFVCWKVGEFFSLAYKCCILMQSLNLLNYFRLKLDISIFKRGLLKGGGIFPGLCNLPHKKI